MQNSPSLNYIYIYFLSMKKRPCVRNGMLNLNDYEIADRQEKSNFRAG